MTKRRGSRLPAVLVAAASTSYAGSCSVGALAAARRGSTRRVRWLHHALYVSTFALTGAAVGAAVLSGDRAGSPLAGALVPLAVIPAVSGRSRLHPAIAATAAPFYAVALSRLRTPSRS